MNNFDPNAVTDAGLTAGTLVGGFTYTTYLEDVALTEIEGEETTSATAFTSTLNGVELVIQENVQGVPEPSSLLILASVVGAGLLKRRRG